MSDPPAGFPVLTQAGAGGYRIRVHARGRDTAPDLVALEPVEWYLIQVWPAPPAPERVLRQTDRYGAELRQAAAAAAPPHAPAPDPGERQRRAVEDNLRRAQGR
jgi:hypothetical protein